MKDAKQPRPTRRDRDGVDVPDEGHRHRLRPAAAPATVLGTVALVVGLLSPVWWAPDRSIAGEAHPITPSSTPARSGPTTTPESETTPHTPDGQSSSQPRSPQRADALPGQRPGTIRLPDGGTATLVRKEVNSETAVLPVPEDLNEATWWGAGLGAEHGASVFAGHVNWKGRTGPFAELWDATSGEDLRVVDQSGDTWHYEVTRTLTLDKDELAERALALFGQQERHRVVLVTCGGRWIGGDEGYTQNRIVIAHAAE